MSYTHTQSEVTPLVGVTVFGIISNSNSSARSKLATGSLAAAAIEGSNLGFFPFVAPSPQSNDEAECEHIVRVWDPILVTTCNAILTFLV